MAFPPQPHHRSKGSASATLAPSPPFQGSEVRALFATPVPAPQEFSPSPLPRPPRNAVTPIVM